MLSIEPKGIITLCKVPFESNGKHNFIFKTKEDRDTYFYGLSDTIQFTDYTYIRRDSTIKFSMDYDSLRDYNYCFYRNTEFTNDIIFAYIDDLMYINENVCSGRLKTDSWQTYGYKVIQDKKSSSFIERMIVAKKEDGIGENYITEDFETGEYYVRQFDTTDIDSYEFVRNDLEPDKEFWRKRNPLIVIGTTEALTGFEYSSEEGEGKMYNGVFSGLYYLAFQNAINAQRYITLIDQQGKKDTIVGIFMLPSKCVGLEEHELGEIKIYEGVAYYTITSSTLHSNDIGNKVSRLTDLSFGGYIPKNNKLYTYPFSYVMCDNNSGGNVIYRYEYFDNPLSPSFRIDGSLTQGGSVRLTPQNYKGIPNNWSEGLNFMKFPTCSWANDSYTNWLTQTAVSRANTREYVKDMKNVEGVGMIGSILSGVGGIVSSVMSGNLGMGVAAFGNTVSLGSANVGRQRGYEEQINSLVASEYEHSLVPPTASNSANMVDVNYSLGLYNVSIYHMRITRDYAEIIDSYFTRYGYKVNKFMNINDCLFTRDKWNYVKTTDCQIEVDIPHQNLNEIKEMFNNGVTLWHEPSAIYKYDSYSNN